VSLVYAIFQGMTLFKTLPSRPWVLGQHGGNIAATCRSVSRDDHGLLVTIVRMGQKPMKIQTPKASWCSLPDWNPTTTNRQGIL